MNKYNFLQNGGFPFETDIFDGMQKAYEIFNSLGALAGNMTIISGCIVTGSTVSNGFVHIDGEIYPFIGGTIQTNVVFQTTTQSVEFKDLTTKQIQENKFVQFGTGVGSMLWANFKRPETTTQLTTLINDLIGRVEMLENAPTSFVIGMVMLWNKPAVDIPIGWVEYTEMRGRMPIGLDENYVQGSDNTNYSLDILGYAGGTREHKLSISEMPAHNHSPGGDSSFCAHGPNGLAAGGDNIGFSGIATQGQDKAHNNMSPYRVVQFIKYVG